MENLRRKVLTKLGSHISTDDIVSGKYVTSRKAEDLAKICMRDIDPDFPKKMASGGFIVAENDFGCGSSREGASVAVKTVGAHAVIAEEFARIFYRNCFNIGLPCIECPGIYTEASIGDELEIDMAGGWVINHTTGKKLKCIPVPVPLQRQIEAGGLIPLLKEELKKD